MKYFRFLVVGNAISAYGSYLNMLALNLFAYELTKSPLFSGLFLAVRLVAGFLTGFVAGRIVDHRRRKPLMVAAELCQATALVILVVAPSAAQEEILYGLAVVTGVGSTISQVCLRAMVPEIVGQDLRTRANSLLVTGRSLAMVLGFASAGIILARIGYHAAFLIDALSFVLSASILTTLPVAGPRKGAQSEADKSRPESFVAVQRTALRFLWTVPILLPMITIRAIDGLGSSSHNVALPVYSSALDPHHPAAFMSRFWMLWAIGNIVFQQLLSWHGKRTGRTFEETAFALGTCVMSAAFILAFCGFPAALTAVIALVAGAADGFTEVSYISRLQSVPDERRGAVFGLSATADNLGVGVGMVLTSSALEFFSPLQVVAVAHGTAIAMALAFLVYLARRRRHPPAPPGQSPHASVSTRTEEAR
ncbi:MFS transporter [Streptomyces sp. SID12501]|uniref:MFS transporter n=1 Tax=Streptomyces sp. SID12501 TaxID=2706042 RepID=A0A6B3C4Z1_9ACTN|nr:MFS transporter [Streptomyces sp. SID12501]